MTALRDAVIRIRTEQVKAKLEAPNIGPAVRAFEQETQAATKAAAEINKATEQLGRYDRAVRTVADSREFSANIGRQLADIESRADAESLRRRESLAAFSERVVQDLALQHKATVQASNAEIRQLETHGHAYEEFGIRSAGALAMAGKGALQLTRAIALMSAAGEEDTRKLLDNLIKVEAGVAALRGGAQLFQVAAAFGPVGIAAAAVTVAVGAGVVAWRRYQNSLEEAAKAARDTRDALRELDTEGQKRIDAQLAAAGESARSRSALGIETALTPEERVRRIDREQARLEGETASALAEEQKLRGALFRRRGYGFGEVAPDQQEIIDRAGGFEGVRDRITTLTEERATNLRRLIDLEQQESQARQEILNQQRQQAIDATGGLSTTNPMFSQNSKRSLDAAFDRQIEDVTKKSQQALDALFQLYNTAQMKAEEERRKLENAFN